MKMNLDYMNAFIDTYIEYLKSRKTLKNMGYTVISANIVDENNGYTCKIHTASTLYKKPNSEKTFNLTFINYGKRV